MKVAWCTPLEIDDPASVASLLGATALAESCEVRVFSTSRGTQLATELPTTTMQPAERFDGFDHVVFNYVNDPELFGAIHQAALTRPGVIVLRSLMLHRLFAGLWLKADANPDRYVDAKKEFNNIVEELVEQIEEISITLEKKSTTEEVVQAKEMWNVYLGTDVVAVVEDGSTELLRFLDMNHQQLLENIEKLKETTDDDEDLAVMNLQYTGNKKYTSLRQYYLQNGLAPKTPAINSWMQYYLLRYPVMTEEEIAIEVFGPLKFSFVKVETP